jgi:hypothetical protein
MPFLRPVFLSRLAACVLAVPLVSPAAPAITALSASPQPATAGQPVTVSWATTNAATLVFNGTTVTGQSSITLPAPATPESWSLSASNPDGSTSRSILIEVLPAPRPTPPIRITEVLADRLVNLPSGAPPGTGGRA